MPQLPAQWISKTPEEDTDKALGEGCKARNKNCQNIKDKFHISHLPTSILYSIQSDKKSSTSQKCDSNRKLLYARVK